MLPAPLSVTYNRYIPWAKHNRSTGPWGTPGSGRLRERKGDETFVKLISGGGKGSYGICGFSGVSSDR
jgi:hypothetical protein